LKYLLLFPPFWSATQPYLSLPALTAYLRKQGHEVKQRDMNLEFLYWLTQSTVVSSLYKDTEDRFGEGEELSLIFKVIKDNLISNSEKYINDLRDKAVFYSSSPEKYRFAQNMINYLYKLTSFKYKPQSISSKGYDVGREVTNTEQVFQVLDCIEENLFYDFYSKTFSNEEVVRNYGIIGISIIGQEQLIPSLVLCKFLKMKYPKSNICVGGPIITRLKSAIEENPQFFSIFDYAIMYEGEYPLHALGKALEGKIELRDVPNLIYHSNKFKYAYLYIDDKNSKMIMNNIRDINGVTSVEYSLSEMSDYNFKI